MWHQEVFLESLDHTLNQKFKNFSNDMKIM